MTSQVAILSTTKLPRFLGEDHPDEESLFAEDTLLAEAFGRMGVEACRVPWRSDEVDWSRFDLVMLRSTWDYIDDLPGFLAVLEAIDGAGCRLANPLATIRWNVDKRYLAELGVYGLPVVPTAYLAAGEGAAAAVAALDGLSEGCVLKPAVGVGGFGVKRLPDRGALAQTLAGSDVAGSWLVQPYLPSIASEGEWSFVFGAGRFLYAALKTPKKGDFRVQVMYGATTTPQAPNPDDLAVARQCLEGLPVRADFARIDMARMTNGQLALMEAELIEPQLYFRDVPGAADKVAEAALDLLSD